MSVLRGFSQLTNSVRSAASDIATTVDTINAFTGGLGNSKLNRIANIADRVGAGAGILGAASSLLNGGDPRELGSALRMFGNATQGVGYGARPRDSRVRRAILSQNFVNTDITDWRVGISVPADLKVGNVLAPLFLNGENVGRMVFPFNPTILLGHSANYSQIAPTHTNYPFNAYENSQVDQITITGEFFSENQDDARYWVATLHFLRTVTKMYYGDSDPQGNPPPVCRLSGYGPHVLNNIPIVVSNFTTDLPADVDYIECYVDEKKNMVPTQCQFTVTVLPTYSRRTAAKFSLQDFAQGQYNKNGLEGFV